MNSTPSPATPFEAEEASRQPTMSATSESPKKKTRRRLRVSCVECTRRRQKCDRNQPCGLCVKRGVTEKCRWENEPFARPSPARPPSAMRGAAAHDHSSPEPILFEQAPAGPNVLDRPQEIPLDPLLQPDILKHVGAANGVGPVDQEVKEAAIALAQLSVARQGDFLGPGSMVCALHKMDRSVTTQIPIDKSTGLPFSSGTEYSSAVSDSFSSSLHELVQSLPEQQECDMLIGCFFVHENWRFGLPKNVIFPMYYRMWDVIRADSTSLNRLKVNWLTLLFAVFALSPGCENEEQSRKFFLRSLTGRRLAEDLLCASFASPRMPVSVTEGTALGCIATVLLANYMCDRGQASEAWKMVGTAVRNAQNAGLHMNPAWNRWKDMTEHEKTIRLCAWHLLAQQDMLLSFILGRPGMVRARDHDVPPPKIPQTPLEPDGSTDTSAIYQACLCTLIDIVGEAKSKYLCLHPELYAGSANIDAEFEAWKGGLPPYFDCRQPDTSLDHIYPNLPLQRCSLAAVYYACTMLFHRSLPYAQPAPLQQLPQMSLTGIQFDLDCRKLASLASELLRTQRMMMNYTHELGRRQPYFIQTFLVFEAAVTLSIALRREPTSLYAEKWQKERQSAIEMLESMKDKDAGDIVRQAILVLRVLQRPRSPQDQNDCAVNSESIPRQHVEMFRPVEFNLLNIPPPSSNSAPSTSTTTMAMPVWHAPLENAVSDITVSAPSSTLPSDMLQSLHMGMDWAADSMSGTMNSFDLLHGLDK